MSVTTSPVRSLADMRATGKMVAKEAGGTTVAAFFEANKDTLKAVLPQHMTPDRLMKIALGALRTTPKLMDATVQSLFGAVVFCAQLGLEPNTPQGHVYLIPFNKRVKDGSKWVDKPEVQVIIGYKGLIDLARRSGQIVSISARTRCLHDEWEMEWGTEDRIKHTPRDGDRGPVVGFYAVAKLKDGGVQFEYMSLKEIEAIRDSSQGYQSAMRAASNGRQPKHPWIDNFEAMGLKTVIRRLTKYLPMSIEMARAVAADEHAETKSQAMGQVLDGAEFTVIQDDDDDAPQPVIDDTFPGDRPLESAQ
ncbi:recombinase RecT [Roseomonas xinghualingensis]|uniref:recombinase RecT n=1 Tax=Roseomonas xinghualingensis TaxID=2986475 RepID=UPI0021F219F7|nr:recombinase RecT [Roseomonas sp. SXEYE001]MCV4210285.1 recombinase RecT [Roseomonas sp. SXEYE001]